MATLTGKTALVTGASRGIGRAIALRLATDGAWVAVHYGTNDAAAKETVAAIEHAGGQAFALRAELGRDDDVDTLFAGLVEGLAGRPLDVLVNNAAIVDYAATMLLSAPIRVVGLGVIVLSFYRRAGSARSLRRPARPVAAS